MRTRSWIAVRVARPTSDLDRAVAFYRDLLGLPWTGGFNDHDGYGGVFFALPGGCELEVTARPVFPDGGNAEELLVLYVDGMDQVEAVVEDLLARGVRAVSNANPYWNRWGRTVLDPDGYRVVIAARDDTAGSDQAMSLRIDWYHGPRAELRPLFEFAEDSQQLLDEYLHLGRVLVASRKTEPVGHLQLIPTDTPGEIELKNMAVVSELRGTGIGRALVEEALRRCTGEGWRRMVVATAAADVGNLRFYQRVGFRIRSVEPDAFTPVTGYPDPIDINGIPLLDRVWFVQEL